MQMLTLFGRNVLSEKITLFSTALSFFVAILLHCLNSNIEGISLKNIKFLTSTAMLSCDFFYPRSPGIFFF